MSALILILVQLLVHSIEEFRIKRFDCDSVWSHTLREGNQVADVLSKFGHSLDGQFKVIDFIPAFILSAILVGRRTFQIVSCFSFKVN